MRSVLCATFVLSTCALAACASQPPRAAQAPVPPRSEATLPHIVTDGAYVARVEREARRRGLTVEWINPPVRRVAGD